MSDPKDHSKVNERKAIDKSFHGLAVGLGLALTIAAVVIVFAYAATDGFSIPAPAAPSEPTSTAAAPPLEVALPTNNNSDTKQEFQLAQDKIQDKTKLADEITTEQQHPAVQNNTEVAAVQEPAYFQVVTSVPVESKPADSGSTESTNDTQSKGQDPTPPASDTESTPTPAPPIPIPPLLSAPIVDGKTSNQESNHVNEFKHEDNKSEDHHKSDVDVKEPKSAKGDKTRR